MFGGIFSGPYSRGNVYSSQDTREDRGELSWEPPKHKRGKELEKARTLKSKIKPSVFNFDIQPPEKRIPNKFKKHVDSPFDRRLQYNAVFPKRSFNEDNDNEISDEENESYSESEFTTSSLSEYNVDDCYLDVNILLDASNAQEPEDAVMATLGNQNIIGVIPKDLKRFINLKILDLSENQIHLHDLSPLENLKELNLSDNQLEQINIPKESFIKLENINLSFNSLPYDSICKIFRLPRLRKLDISANDLPFIPYDITFCKNLSHLNLENNYLEDDVLLPLSTLPNLEELNLKENRIGCVPQIGIGEEVFAKLKLLDLSYNFIQYFEDVFSLIEIASLKQINLIGNPLCDRKKDLYVLETELRKEEKNMETRETLRKPSKTELVVQSLRSQPPVMSKEERKLLFSVKTRKANSNNLETPPESITPDLREPETQNTSSTKVEETPKETFFITGTNQEETEEREEEWNDITSVHSSEKNLHTNRNKNSEELGSPPNIRISNTNQNQELSADPHKRSLSSVSFTRPKRRTGSITRLSFKSRNSKASTPIPSSFAPTPDSRSSSIYHNNRNLHTSKSIPTHSSTAMFPFAGEQETPRAFNELLKEHNEPNKLQKEKRINEKQRKEETLRSAYKKLRNTLENTL
eukprot:gb/GECH01002719.1/.p1 GENE.gb/GECH01002719.1/~~gb/GECH01002719.1/.p1  ORF type:complete len:639 (+),score=181.67 gb/GECH01002719.1/:1-1917(+)